jgi:hypothetical protein
MERYFKASPTQWGPGKIHLARWSDVVNKWTADCSSRLWPGVVLPAEGGDYPVNCKLCLKHLEKQGARKQNGHAYA